MRTRIEVMERFDYWKILQVLYLFLDQLQNGACRYIIANLLAEKIQKLTSACPCVATE
jgi:hypothetical protein